MKDYNASSYSVVTMEVARLLRDPDHLRYIAPFIGQARLIHDVAKEINSTLSTTYRRVRRYCDVGILEVVAEKERNGKSLKYYRSVAASFFIPSHLLEDMSDHSKRWQAHWEDDFQRGLHYAYGHQLQTWGDRIYRRDGVLTIRAAKNPHEDIEPLAADMPAVVTTFHDSLYLDFRHAKAFQRELLQLAEKYQQQQGEQRYMMQLRLVPVPVDAEIMP